MTTKLAVFVTAVEADGPRVLVEATNGGLQNPFIRFSISRENAVKVHIGKKYNLTIEDAEERALDD